VRLSHIVEVWYDHRLKTHRQRDDTRALMPLEARKQGDELLDRPRFCPRCHKPRPSAGKLCQDCGETLLDRGYCEICEDWLLLPSGSECPKHEIPLVDGPSSPDFDVSASSRLVTIATYGVTSEALGPRLRLQAEGISVFLDGERMGTIAIHQVATGGVKLQVPEDQAAEARILLSQKWSAVEDDLDDPWEGLEPPHPAERRRSVMKGMILFYLFWPALVAVVIALLSFVISMVP
jgi:hypothetical protein